MSDAPYGYDEPQPGASPDPAVKGRVLAPGVFLIVIGALNVIAGVFFGGAGLLNLAKSPAQMQQDQITLYKQLISDPDLQKQMLDQLQKQDPQVTYSEAVWGNIGSGLLWLIVGLIIIWAAARMMGLKSYGLAVTGSILAAIPCISCPGGCCLLGQIAGIWALIVLMNTDVRSSFR